MNRLNWKQCRNSLWQLTALYIVSLLLMGFFLWQLKYKAAQARSSNKENINRFDKEKVFLDLAHASPILDTLMAEEMKRLAVLYVPNDRQKNDYQHFKDILFAAYRIKTIDAVYYNALLGVFQTQEIAYQNIRFLKQAHRNKLPPDSLIIQLENAQRQIHYYQGLYEDCHKRPLNSSISK